METTSVFKFQVLDLGNRFVTRLCKAKHEENKFGRIDSFQMTLFSNY